MIKKPIHRKYDSLKSMSNAAKAAYSESGRLLSVSSTWKIIAILATVGNALAILFIAFSTLETNKSDVTDKEILLLSITELTEQRRNLEADISSITDKKNSVEATAEATKRLSDTRARELSTLNFQLSEIMSQIELEQDTIKQITIQRDELIRERLLTDIGARLYVLIANDGLAGGSFDRHSYSEAAKYGQFKSWRRSMREYYPPAPTQAHAEVMRTLGDWLSELPMKDRKIGDEIFAEADRECRSLKIVPAFKLVAQRPTVDGSESLDEVIALFERYDIGVINYIWPQDFDNQQKLNVYRRDLIVGYIHLFNVKKNQYLNDVNAIAHKCLGLSSRHFDIDSFNALDRDSITYSRGKDIDAQEWADEHSFLFRQEGEVPRDPSNHEAIRSHIADRFVDRTK